MRDEPFHLERQSAQRKVTFQPSRHPMHTAVTYCWRPSICTYRNTVQTYKLFKNQIRVVKSSTFYNITKFNFLKKPINKLTGIALRPCWIGVRKKVPSIRGYLSNTRRAWWHKTQAVRHVRWVDKVDNMKLLVSSFPYRPSSSICLKIRAQGANPSLLWHEA